MSPGSRIRAAASALGVLAAVIVAQVAFGAKGDTTLISRASGGGLAADAESGYPWLSGSGRFVLFYSYATNLSGADDDAYSDAFLYDSKTRKVRLVSRASNGGPGGNADTTGVSVSASGRFAALESYATNLSGADNDSFDDVFVYDRKTRKVSLVSRRSRLGAGGNGNSNDASLSSSGRFVAIQSKANNLSGADQNGTQDIYLYDRKRHRMKLVSRAPNGGPGGDGDSYYPTISADGRFVAFMSQASNLTGANLNAIQNIYLYDRKHGSLRLVSRGSNGGAAADGNSDQVSISGSGRFVAFDSLGTNLSLSDGDSTKDVFVYDRKTNTVQLGSRRSNGGTGGDLDSYDPAISSSGRFVGFDSDATNLSGADGPSYDVFVYDRKARKVRLVSRASGGGLGGDDGSDTVALSGSGRFAAFESYATNFSAADLDSTQDVFVHDLLGP